MEFVFFLVLFIVLVVVIMIVGQMNAFVALRNKVKQSKSSIEVYLNQRFDLIPNLVECVKGYAKYEQETLTKIAKLRSEYMLQNDKDLKLGAQIDHEMKTLFALGEDNPNLQASEQFLQLQKSISRMEDQLQAARRLYNGDVTLYNTTISTFPNNLLASMGGFKKFDLFEIEEYKRANVSTKI